MSRNRKRINLPYDRGSSGPRLSVSAAATYMGCSESWVYKLVAARELDALRIGSRRGIQIPIRSIDCYLTRKIKAAKVTEKSRQT